MSLRAFHIVFIVVSVVLSFYVGLWGIREFADERDASVLAIGVLFLVMAVGLTVYGRKTFRKLKELP